MLRNLILLVSEDLPVEKEHLEVGGDLQVEVKITETEISDEEDQNLQGDLDHQEEEDQDHQEEDDQDHQEEDQDRQEDDQDHPGEDQDRLGDDQDLPEVL